MRIGVPHANRTRMETERIVGLFVNMQVLRAQVHGALTGIEFLQQVRQVVHGAQSHPDVPFDQLVQALQPQRDLTHSPLVRVVMNHQRLPADTIELLPGVTLESYAPGGSIGAV